MKSQSTPRSCLLLIAVVSQLAAHGLRAQQDAAPVDAANLLQALRGLKQSQTTQVKASRAKALQDVQAAAASGGAAVSLWMESVRVVQFSGDQKEGPQFRDWKEKEGEAFKEKEPQLAARLYFTWLGLTLQRSGGTPVKELLPAVVQYTKDVLADQAAMEALVEQIKHDKERGAKHASAKENAKDSELAKKMHDEVLHKSLAGSPPVLALRIGEFVNVPEWVGAPDDVEAIYSTIILPEFRVQRDPRVLEYWDMKVQRETEAANKAKLAFDKERFFQVRRPELLWKKAQDALQIGQKNRAVTDMFGLIKAYPAHPSAAEWMNKLEQLLTPPPAAAVPAAAVPAAAVPAAAVPAAVPASGPAPSPAKGAPLPTSAPVPVR